MSIEPQPKVQIPQFNEARIRQVLDGEQANPDGFRRVQLGAMRACNPPLEDFFTKTFAGYNTGGDDRAELGRTWMRGYVIGHAALRTPVTPGVALPIRGIGALDSIQQHITSGHEPSLGAMIDEDYAGHEAMLALLKEFEAEHGNPYRRSNHTECLRLVGQPVA